MKTILSIFILLLMGFSPTGAYSYMLVRYTNDMQGVTLQVPKVWLEKSFKRGSVEFFPTQKEGAFLEIQVMGPAKDDYSTVNLDFFRLDLFHSLERDKRISGIKDQAYTLSDLPAYRADFNIRTPDGKFRTSIIFAAANEKIYLIRFQAFENDFQYFEKLIFNDIIPTYTITVIASLEMRYAHYAHSGLNFSLYYPALWRLIDSNVSAEPTVIYQDHMTGFNVMGRASDAKPTIRALGYDSPIAIAPDPNAVITIKLIHMPQKIEIPAYAIEWYAKSVQKEAKELKGYKHLRQFQSKISGNLAMEYVYLYKDTTRDDEEKEFIVKYYITFGHNQLYVMVYAAPDDVYSKYFKEVERLVRHFKIH